MGTARAGWYPSGTDIGSERAEGDAAFGPPAVGGDVVLVIAEKVLEPIGGKGQLAIDFAKDDDGVLLTIADNGIGLITSATSNPSTYGLGTRFIAAFVRQLGATQAIATGDSGTSISVRLPRSILVEMP